MDSLTQLQDWLDFMAEKFYSAIGVLQRDTRPSADGQTIDPAAITNIESFVREIVHAAKVSNAIISQLPRTQTPPEQQATQLRALDLANKQAGERLEATVQRAEALLASVRAALQEIANDRLADAQDLPPF